MSNDTPETKAPDTSKVDDKPVETTAPKQQETSTITQTKKTSPRKTKSWIIIAIVLLLVIGAGAYFAWMMQPANAIANSFSNLVKSRNDSFSFELKLAEGEEMVSAGSGQVGYKNDQFHLKAEAPEGGLLEGTLEAKHLGEGGSFFKVTGVENSLVNLQKSLFSGFMEASNPDIDMDQLMASMEEGMRAEVRPMAEVIEGNWVSVDTETLKNGVDERSSENYQCLQESIKLLDSRSSRNEVERIYKDNQFIVVEEELGTKDGAIGFVISIDEDILEDFTTALKDTDFYKKIEECTKSEEDADAVVSELDVFTPVSLNTSDTKVEIWIERFSHQLRSAKFTSYDRNDNATGVLTIDFTADFEADFSQPDGATPLEDVMRRINEISDGQAPVEGEANVQPEAVQ